MAGHRVRYTLVTNVVNELVEAADEKMLTKTIASTPQDAARLVGWLVSDPSRLDHRADHRLRRRLVDPRSITEDGLAHDGVGCA